MTTTPALLPPRERIDAAAHAQLALPGDTLALRRIYEDLVPDLWAMSVKGPDRLGVAVLRVAGGRITVPAGLDQAGRELAAMNVLSLPAWKGSLVYLVTAAGGMTPGWPDVPEAAEARDGGGARLVLSMTEPWVRYAASGGVGPPPSVSSSPGEGVKAPERVGTATLEISSDYALRWTYRIGGREIGSCGARPAAAEPSWTDEELLALVDLARQRAGAPRAMPESEPRPLEGKRPPGAVAVDLCAIGPVRVDVTPGSLHPHEAGR
jgi:hypothetical protein